MVKRLRLRGVELSDELLEEVAECPALGRRHLAELMVKSRSAGSIRDAFHRFLHDGGSVAVPKERLPVEEAIALIGGAGGVAAWAHPSYDCNGDNLRQLRDYGLGAIEAVYPGFRLGRTQELRELGRQFGLAVTGGSDCHGPDQPRRGVGACTITSAELELLRSKATNGGSR